MKMNFINIFCVFMVKLITLQGAHLLELVVTPKNRTIRINATAILRCKFSEPVACSWQRDHKPLPIGGRLEYLKLGADLEKSADCSIVIRRMQQADVGSYSCQSLDTETSLVVTSNPLFLSILKTPTEPIVTNSGVLIDSLDRTVTPENLCCRASRGNPPAILHWEDDSNFRTTEMSPTYTEVGDSLYDTELCWNSYRARVVLLNHPYTHSLRCVGRHPGYSKASAYIDIPVSYKGERWLKLVVAPQNYAVVINGTASLTCQFNEPVWCAWQWNRNSISIGVRYQYVNPLAASESVADCSIIIYSVQQNDMGSWRCQSKKKSSTTRAVTSEPAFLSIRKTPTKPTVEDNGKPMDSLHQTFIPENLCCKAGGGNPPAELHWEVDGVMEITEMTTNNTRVGFNMYDTELCWDNDFALFMLHRARTFRCVGRHPGYDKGIAYIDIPVITNEANSSSEQKSTNGTSNQVVFIVIGLIIGVIAIGLVVFIIKMGFRFKKRSKESNESTMQLSAAQPTPEMAPQVDIMEFTYAELIHKPPSDVGYLVPRSKNQAPRMPSQVDNAELTYAELILKPPSEASSSKKRATQMAPRDDLTENTYAEILHRPPRQSKSQEESSQTTR